MPKGPVHVYPLRRSVGMVILELLDGHFLSRYHADQESEMLEAIASPHFVHDLHARVDAVLRDRAGLEGQMRGVLKGLLAADPDLREDAGQALRHSAITGQEATVEAQYRQRVEERQLQLLVDIKAMLDEMTPLVREVVTATRGHTAMLRDLLQGERGCPRYILFAPSGKTGVLATLKSLYSKAVKVYVICPVCLMVST